MEDNLPNMTIGPTRFRTAINDQYMMMAATGSFVPNPPSLTEMMTKAIEAVVFQYSIGSGMIDRKLEKLSDDGEPI